MVGRISRLWTAEEDAVLIQMATAGATADQIGRRLRRTAGAVTTRAEKLGLKLKSARWLKTVRSRHDAARAIRGLDV
jgi:hypothetical protein